MHSPIPSFSNAQFIQSSQPVLISNIMYSTVQSRKPDRDESLKITVEYQYQSRIVNKGNKSKMETGMVKSADPKVDYRCCSLHNAGKAWR